MSATPPKRIGTGLPASYADRFRAYTDRLNALVVVAPVGWRCAARYFEDGTGGLMVMPPDVASSPDNLPPLSERPIHGSVWS